jgi:hypothetical protein
MEPSYLHEQHESHEEQSFSAQILWQNIGEQQPSYLLWLDGE